VSSIEARVATVAPLLPTAEVTRCCHDLPTWRCPARSNCSCCWPTARSPRTWRSWCSATSSPCCAARPHDLSSSPPTAPACRRQPHPAQSPLVVGLRHPGDAAGLAPAPGRRHLDLPPPWSRATITRRGRPAAHRPPGQRQPPLGLPAHPRRSAAPGRAGLGIGDPQYPSSLPARPSATADDHDLAGGPSPAGRRHRRLRFLDRRHHLAAAAVGAVLHRAGHPPGPPGWRDTQPQRRLDHPASRNLLLVLQERTRRTRFLIRDRDAKFCRGFDDVFGSEGVDVLVTPVQAPNDDLTPQETRASARPGSGNATAPGGLPIAGAVENPRGR
jgi:hypothetical protein